MDISLAENLCHECHKHLTDSECKLCEELVCPFDSHILSQFLHTCKCGNSFLVYTPLLYKCKICMDDYDDKVIAFALESNPGWILCDMNENYGIMPEYGCEHN